MRWLKFTASDKASWGIVEGDQVIAVTGDPFGEWQRTSRTHPLSQVKIELPLIPRTFYCVGLNYLKHLKEAADKRGEVPAVPDRPEIGYRAQNALIAHDEEVVIPSFATDKIHYEGELVVVIGKKVKHLTKQTAMDCVFGYTIGNDVSERSWQKADRSLWRSKNADTFKPMGPWIETEADLAKMETVVRVNGKETNRFHTNDMIFGVVGVPGGADEILHAMARRCDLDGYRRCVAGHQARRCRGDRHHRCRDAAEQVRAGGAVGCLRGGARRRNTFAHPTQLDQNGSVSSLNPDSDQLVAPERPFT
ncbi:2-keto-4-pentenoate hydratase/2-oxohepta-3-ene-1,7-dioic acid hydratase in catechol pathway [Bradyrhizobium sp. LB9.1b]